MLAKAREYQAERRKDMSKAQMAFNELLDSMGILYESEAIILNGDRFVLIDALMRKEKIALEVDGKQHERQAKYDTERDAWLLRRHKIKTLRFADKDVFRQSEAVRARIAEAINAQ